MAIARYVWRSRDLRLAYQTQSEKDQINFHSKRSVIQSRQYDSSPSHRYILIGREINYTFMIVSSLIDALMKNKKESLERASERGVIKVY